MNNDRRDDIARLLWGLEELALAAGADLDRRRARRAVLDQLGDQSEVWDATVVLSLAGQQEGFVIRRRDLALGDLIGLLDGEHPRLLVGPRGAILLAREAARGQVLVASPEDEEQWQPLENLATQLGMQSVSDRISILSAEVAMPGQGIGRDEAADHGGHGGNGHGHSGGGGHGHGHDDHHSDVSPLYRLLDFIRPDMGDVWIIVLFAALVGVLALATPIAVEALVNTVAFGNYLQPVIILSLMLLVFLGFGAGIRALQTYIAEIIQRRLFVRVVADLAVRLPRTRIDSASPEMVNRFFDIVTVQKVSASLLLDGVTIVLQAVIGMAVLAFYHPILLGFDIFLVIAMAVILFVMGNGAVESAIAESRRKYAVAAWLEELARHPNTFRLEGGAAHAMESADRLANQYLDARESHFGIFFSQVLFILALQALAATILLGLGGWLVINGSLTLGQLVAAELITAIILGSFAKLGKHVEGYYDLMASMDKLGHLFDLPLERSEGGVIADSSEGAEVRVNNVSFSYDGHRSLINHFGMHVPAGARVAITSPPGSGKSTLLELIYALRDPQHGYIEIDGSDLRTLQPRALRRIAALVQNPEAFVGSLAENVHLDRPTVTPADVRWALDEVGLLEEVMALPDGLNTMVADEGAPLSKTQVLRLMLARAIASRPRLLLIDGTFDEMPDELTARVSDAILDRRHSWTVIVVSGRQEVLDRCDEILSLGPSPDAAHSLAPV